MTTIVVHSFKGGTGKSLIAVNLAYYYNLIGKKVLLIDGDYTAPCLDSYFPNKTQTYFSSYLNDTSTLKKSIQKTQFKNLSISHSAPPNFSEEILTADTQTHGKYLKQMMRGIKIAEEELGFDKVVFDTTNGVNLPAINQLAISDISVIAIRPTRYGILSTAELINVIYSKLTLLSNSRRKDYFVWNQVPKDNNKKNEIQNYINKWTNFLSTSSKLNYATSIPYSQEITIEMLVDSIIDLQKVYSIIEPHIKELIRRIV